MRSSSLWISRNLTASLGLLMVNPDPSTRLHIEPAATCAAGPLLWRGPARDRLARPGPELVEQIFSLRIGKRGGLDLFLRPQELLELALQRLPALRGLTGEPRLRRRHARPTRHHRAEVHIFPFRMALR